jgi:prefoldin subunit 5
MERRYRIETPDTDRAARQITAMVADMERVVAMLGEDIAATEARAEVYDKTDVAYPPLAKALWDRQNNLKRTVAELQRRLQERPTVALETAA